MISIVRARAPSGCKGAVDAKLKLLREIVRQTDARLVLISSWKKYWKREETTDPDMLYLMRKLKRFGLSIYDKTEESFWANRGEGIHVWLSANEDVTAWVVLDDETFPDYEKYGIDKHLVKTKFFYEKDAGLQEEHAEQAIAILNSCETEIANGN
ncbi:MAG: HAD domain-containing protein [Anaerotignum faecicola]